MAGWTPEAVERARNTRVPQTLKCSGCESQLPQSAFSDTQITKLRNQIAIQGPAAVTRHKIRCKNCTGGGVPEGITCLRCRVTKPLESYAKVQRRDVDRATCKTCAAEQLMTEDWVEPEDNRSLVDMSDTLSSIAESTGGVSLPGFGDQRSLDGGVWVEDSKPISYPTSVEQSTIRGASSTAAATSTANYSGWNVESFQEDAREARVPSNNAFGEAKTTKKAWATVKSHDPYRAARIMRASDPVKDQGSDETAETIVGAKMEKRIREELGRS